MFKELRRKVSYYTSEVLFVLRNGIDWRTRVKLLTNTALFHVSNRLSRRSGGESFFTARLRFGDREAEIVIRRFSGDIFVLFEVLMQRCYYIPGDLLSPAGVRV